MPLTQDHNPFAAVSGLKIAVCGDESVVFNPSSWETHVLSPAASLLLDALVAEPRTEDELSALLSQALEDEDRPQAAAQVKRLISDFLRLRLIRPLPATSDAGQ